MCWSRLLCVLQHGLNVHLKTAPLSRAKNMTFIRYSDCEYSYFSVIVWCVMSFLPFLLPKLILLAFCPSWGSNKPKILGFNFSHPSTPFYATIFKKAGSKLNMPHIDHSKLHTITNFVSEPTFLIMRNDLVYVKVILEWQPS